MKRYSVSRIVLAVMASLLLRPAHAQPTVAPEIQVTTDKNIYQQYEPVMVEVSLTNPDSEEQDFGPTGLPRPYSLLGYLLFDPQGQRLIMHNLFRHSFVHWALPPYAPGETRSEAVNLLLFYGIMEQTGTYTLEVRFLRDLANPGAGYETANTSFEVQAPPGVSASVLSALGRAKRDMFDGHEWFALAPDTTTAAERLDFVLSSQGLPPYLLEYAQYLRALYAELNSQKGDGTLAERQQRYASFLDAYPASVYAKEATFGITAATYTIEELTPSPVLPDLPDLPGAITFASDDASASFSGNAFAINGNDHTLSGQPNPSGDDAHGIFTTTAVSQQSLLDALKNNQRDNITGSGPDPDIAQDALAFDPTALIDALLALVTETLTTSPGGTLGSPEAPVVAYAPDGLTLTGNLDGTGVLIVDGSYAQRGSVQWTGLVVVRADEEVPPSFEMRGNVGVIGGVLILNETNQAASLEVTGSAEVRYSREVFEMLRAALFPNP